MKIRIKKTPRIAHDGMLIPPRKWKMVGSKNQGTPRERQKGSLSRRPRTVTSAWASAGFGRTRLRRLSEERQGP